MLIAHAMVVLNVYGVQAGTYYIEILPVEWPAQITVAKVVAYAYMLRIVEGIHQLHQLMHVGAEYPLVRGGAVLKVVLQRNADAAFPCRPYVFGIILQIMLQRNVHIRASRVNRSGVCNGPFHAQLRRGYNGTAYQLLHDLYFFFVIVGEYIVIRQM